MHRYLGLNLRNTKSVIRYSLNTRNFKMQIFYPLSYYMEQAKFVRILYINFEQTILES